MIVATCAYAYAFIHNIHTHTYAFIHKYIKHTYTYTYVNSYREKREQLKFIIPICKLMKYFKVFHKYLFQ